MKPLEFFHLLCFSRCPRMSGLYVEHQVVSQHSTKMVCYTKVNKIVINITITAQAQQINIFITMKLIFVLFWEGMVCKTFCNDLVKTSKTC